MSTKDDIDEMEAAPTNDSLKKNKKKNISINDENVNYKNLILMLQ